MGKKKANAKPKDNVVVAPQDQKPNTLKSGSEKPHKELSNKPSHVANDHQRTPNGVGVGVVATITSRDDFLKLFWNLAESDVQLRNAATQGILKYLRNVQQHQPAAAHDQQDQHEQPPPPQFQDEKDYTLKRLIRGLASSRDAARQGFSCALANLLRAFPQHIALNHVLDLVAEYMQVRQSQKGMEQREHMFGKLFGLLAVQRSGRLRDVTEETQVVVVRVIRELIELSKWKKWLREAAFDGVLTCLTDLPRETFATQLVPDFTNLLNGNVEDYNAEQVALAAGVQQYLVATQAEHDPKQVIPDTFQHFLSRKQMHKLVEPLKTASGCFPRIHSAWYGIFGHLLALSSPNDQAKIDGELFQETWQVLVEDFLLTGTHERKSTALKLFELLVPVVPSGLLRTMVTPHLVRCLFVNAVNVKTYLHAASLHALDVFCHHAPQEFVAFVMNHFARPHAALVDDVLKDPSQSLEDEEIRDLEEEMHTRVQQARIWLVELLCHAVTQLMAASTSSSTSTSTSTSRTSKNASFARLSELEKHHLAQEIIRFLILQSYFKPKKNGASSTSSRKHSSKAMDLSTMLVTSVACTTVTAVKAKHKLAVSAQEAANQQVRGYCKKRLMALLNLRDSLASSSTALLLVVRVFEVLQDTLNQPCSPFELRLAPKPQETKQLDQVVDLVARLDAQVKELASQPHENPADEEKAKRRRKQLDAFGLLLRTCGLQLVDEEPSEREEMVVIIDDCVQCLHALTCVDKPKPASVDDDQEQSMVVLVDLLLSLLAKDSRGLRAIVMQVFASVWHRMTPKCLATLLEVVTKPSVTPNEGTNDEEDDDEEVDDDEEDQDEDMENHKDDEEEEEEDDDEEEEIVLSSASAMANVLDVEEAALVSIVQQVQAKQEQKQSHKKLQLQTLHFQMRVVDVLQLMLQKATAKSKPANDSTTSHKTLLLVVPLYMKVVQLGKQHLDSEEIGASAKAIRGATMSLKDKIQSLVKNKLLTPRDLPRLAWTKEDLHQLDNAESHDEEQEEDTMVASVSMAKCIQQARELLGLLSDKQLERDVAALGAKALAYLVRVLSHSLAPQEEVEEDDQAAIKNHLLQHVRALMTKCVHESFGKKHSRFPRSFFDELLGTNITNKCAWELFAVVLPALVQQLVRHCADEFSQVETFKWITLLLKHSINKAAVEASAAGSAVLTAFGKLHEQLADQLVIHLSSPVQDASKEEDHNGDDEDDDDDDDDAEEEEEEEKENKDKKQKKNKNKKLQAVKPMKAKRLKVIVQCAAAFLKLVTHMSNVESAAAQATRVRETLDQLQSNSPAIKNILTQISKDLPASAPTPTLAPAPTPAPAPALAPAASKATTPTKSSASTPTTTPSKKTKKTPMKTPPNTPASTKKLTPKAITTTTKSPKTSLTKKTPPSSSSSSKRKRKHSMAEDQV